MKFKWRNHFVLSAAGADNHDSNPNNFISTLKDTKLFVPVVALSTKDNQRLTKLLSKGFERSVNVKQKLRVKRWPMIMDILSNETFLSSTYRIGSQKHTRTNSRNTQHHGKEKWYTKISYIWNFETSSEVK